MGQTCASDLSKRWFIKGYTRAQATHRERRTYYNWIVQNDSGSKYFINGVTDDGLRRFTTNFFNDCSKQLTILAPIDCRNIGPD